MATLHSRGDVAARDALRVCVILVAGDRERRNAHPLEVLVDAAAVDHLIGPSTAYAVTVFMQALWGLADSRGPSTDLRRR